MDISVALRFILYGYFILLSFSLFKEKKITRNRHDRLSGVIILQKMDIDPMQSTYYLIASLVGLVTLFKMVSELQISFMIKIIIDVVLGHVIVFGLAYIWDKSKK